MRTIEDLRKAKDILQIEMAKTLDMPVSTYNMYENGKRRVPGEVEFSEYNKDTNIWRNSPSAMIQKVAEVFVLKRAFGINGHIKSY